MQINDFTVLISGSYNAFSEGWNGAGVYACSGNYVSQTFKTPWYIGSAEDLRKRIISDHISDLDTNSHPHNPPLQNAWNKHSESEGFIWFLLESCPLDKTLEVEQKYLDLYRPFVDEFGGFNIAHLARGGGTPMSEENKQKLREANSGENNPFFGRKHTKETKEKISVNSLAFFSDPENKKKFSQQLQGKKRSEIHKQKLSQRMTGEKNPFFGKTHTEETKKKISDARIGIIFSDEQKRKMSENYEKRKIKPYENQLQTHTIKSPTGEIITFTGLKKFCRETGLDRNGVSKILKGIIPEYHGWTLP